MAKKYVRPVLRMEEFVSNEFVSNCYTMNCDIAGWFHDDNGDGKYNSGEEKRNGGSGEVIIRADSTPTIQSDKLYKDNKQPSNWLEWTGYIISLVIARGTKYDSVLQDRFTPTSLYIVNDGGTTYGSTQQPTPVPGHPNRS